MKDHRPFLLLRAKAKDAERPRFESWFRQTHLADVRRIPGISDVQSGRTAAGTHLAFYYFENSEVVQAALNSPEAAYARGSWENWAPHLDELLLELWAPLLPLPIYQSAS